MTVIVILALVAVFIGLRLYSVLGERTARRAFNEFWSFFAAWGQMLTYIITIAISAFFI